jgi:hypothetical protein
VIPLNPAAIPRSIGAWNGSDVSPGGAFAPPSVGNDAGTDMPNLLHPLHPDRLTPAERLDEVARLLALGFLRLRARRQRLKANDPNHLREFGLDFRGEGSVMNTDIPVQRSRL